MIIQCRKCETRFRFDDALMVGEGVWVRCSRCQNVFFQEPPADAADSVEPEIPSVRVSDARRNPEDRFSPVGDRSIRTEPQAEAPLPSPTLGEGDTETVIEREPLIEKPGEELGEDSSDVRIDSDEKELEDTAEEEPSGGGREKAGWGRTMLKLIALSVFLFVVAGIVALYVSPDIRNQVLTMASPLLRGVPVLEELVAPPMKSGQSAQEPVRLKDIRQRSIANLLAGNVRVIEGVAVNQAPYPISKIKVRLVIADAYDVVLGEKLVYCGNLLTDAELGALADAEIQRELSIQQGSDVSNERIAPNGEIPFMIVFSQDQAGAIKTTVTPAGADRLP